MNALKQDFIYVFLYIVLVFYKGSLEVNLISCDPLVNRNIQGIAVKIHFQQPFITKLRL